MNLLVLYAALGAVSLVGSPTAQGPAVIVRQSFDEDDGGWTGAGMNARVSLTHQSTFNGAGALKFEYDLKKGVMGAMMLPTPDALLARVRTIRFWISADHATTIIVALQEQGGGRYIAPACVPKGAWQKVELSVDDFTLSADTGAPKDTDGRLDMDAVGAVSIADMHQMAAAPGNPDMLRMFGIEAGARAILVDDFSATAESLPAAMLPVDSGFRLDTFARPQIGWLEVGCNRVDRREGKPLAGKGMQCEYRRAPGRMIALMRSVPQGRLAGTTQLTFAAAAQKETTLIVQLEESGGGKFNVMTAVAGGGVRQRVTIKFGDLNPGSDSKVKDRAIDLSLVNQLALIDPAGMLGLAAEESNTLWIGDLVARRDPNQQPGGSAPTAGAR